MKKLILVLLAGMLLTPSEMFAEKYNSKRVAPAEPPARVPALYHIGLYLDESTGDLYICPNYDIAGLTVTIAQDGVACEEATVTLAAGQAYTTTMAGYAYGDYTLTLTNSDGDVIDQYVITVEED